MPKCEKCGAELSPVSGLCGPCDLGWDQSDSWADFGSPTDELSVPYRADKSIDVEAALDQVGFCRHHDLAEMARAEGQRVCDNCYHSDRTAQDIIEVETGDDDLTEWLCAECRTIERMAGIVHVPVIRH